MLLIVGRVIRPHGIRGEVVVEVRSDDPADKFTPGTVYVTDPPGAPLTLEAARQHTTAGKQRLLLALKEITDRDAADGLRGTFLGVEVEELAPIDDPDEFHDRELIGLAVVTAEGEALGKVVRVIHGPAHEHLVVRRSGAPDALVPFVSQIVPEIDIPGGRIVVTPPGGLFDL